MKIINNIKQQQFISLEYFPPKGREEWPAFFRTVERLTEIDPLFVSVTYGAGGSTHQDSLEIVTTLQKEFQQQVMAHLTCIGSTPDKILPFLDQLAAAGVSNILALRGDPPMGESVPPATTDSTLQHASDLVPLIKAAHPDFGIAVAAYPEPHPESESAASDLNFLKLKLQGGGDFAITQLFFDNSPYHDFVRTARRAGISKPIIPGILPVVNLKVLKRIVSLCGASIPADFLAELEAADARGGAPEVQKIGLRHARQQAEDLLKNGAPGVHIYTLNRAEIVLELTQGLLPQP